jgi:hypothetical protein
MEIIALFFVAINQAYRLPGVLPPYAETVSMPDSVFANAFMDSDFGEWAWQLIFGGSMRSANTPAVAQSGRVYVVGSSVRKGFGSHYFWVTRSPRAMVPPPSLVTLCWFQW